MSAEGRPAGTKDVALILGLSELLEAFSKSLSALSLPTTVAAAVVVVFSVVDASNRLDS